MLFVVLLLIMVMAIVLVFFALTPIRISNKQISVFWIMFIVLFAYVGFHVNPTPDLDIYRIYRYIDNYREGNITSIFATPTFIMNIVYWLIAHLKNNGWFVSLTIIIWGMLINGIFRQYSKKKIIVHQSVFIYFLASLGSFFVVYLISGSWCSIAVTLWAYAYYRWSEHKKWLFYVIGIMSIFIHSTGIVLMIFTIIFQVLQRKHNFKSYFFVFIAIVALGYVLNNPEIMKFTSKAGFSYGILISEKINAYSMRGVEFQQVRELLFRIVTSLFLLFSIGYLHLKNNMKNEIFGFFILVMFAGYNMSILFERIPYLLGVCSLPIFNETIMESKKGWNYFYIIMSLLLFGLQVAWGCYETKEWITFI